MYFSAPRWIFHLVPDVRHTEESWSGAAGPARQVPTQARERQQQHRDVSRRIWKIIEMTSPTRLHYSSIDTPLTHTTNQSTWTTCWRGRTFACLRMLSAILRILYAILRPMSVSLRLRNRRRSVSVVHTSVTYELLHVRVIGVFVSS